MAQNGARQRTLTVKQERAVASLMLSTSVKSAARDAGVGRRTLCRWMEQAEFKAALGAAEQDVLSTASRRLAGITDKAIENVERLLTDASVPDTIKLKAAFGALEQALRWRDQTVLEDRLAVLERKLGASR